MFMLGNLTIWSLDSRRRRRALGASDGDHCKVLSLPPPSPLHNCYLFLFLPPPTLMTPAAPPLIASPQLGREFGRDLCYIISIFVLIWNCFLGMHRNEFAALKSESLLSFFLSGRFYLQELIECRENGALYRKLNAFFAFFFKKKVFLIMSN